MKGALFVSNTYDFDQPIDRWNTGCRKWDFMPVKYGGTDLIPMWIADMDFATLPEVTQALIRRASHPIYGYIKVKPEYHQAIIHWYQARYSSRVTEEMIIDAHGVMPSINWMVQTFTMPGDKVVIFEPVYQRFKRSIENNDRVACLEQLTVHDGKYRVDMAALEADLAAGARMLIFCNPHNPVGRVWTREELKAIGDLCRKYNAVIVSDEIHCDLTYPGHPHVPFFEVAPDNSIVCAAPSKTFNVAGLHLSYIITANPEYREKIDDCIRRVMMDEPDIMAVEAAQAAYEHGGLWVDELVAYIKSNMDYAIDFLAQHMPKVKVVPPESTYLLWADFRGYSLNHEEIFRIICQEAHIAINDGIVMGQCADGFMRFNLALPRQRVVKAFDQLLEAFRGK